jgi:hypothetical protein
MAADESRRVARLLAAAVAAVVVFGLCLWLFRFARFSWLPRAEADRWAVGAAFATVVASAVLAGVAWWAGHENQPPAASDAQPGRWVSQRARASGRSRVTQVGRDQHNYDGHGRDG